MNGGLKKSLKADKQKIEFVSSNSEYISVNLSCISHVRIQRVLTKALAILLLIHITISRWVKEMNLKQC